MYLWQFVNLNFAIDLFIKLKCLKRLRLFPNKQTIKNL